MFNISTLKTDLISLVGYRQSNDPDAWTLDDADLTTASSGLYFNDAHPLVTIENLMAVAQRYDLHHSEDDAIRDQRFTAWLKGLTEGWIIETVTEWMARKFPERSVHNLLEDHSRLYKATGDPGDLVDKKNAVVGLEIALGKSRNLKLKIRSLGFRGVSAETLTVNLFKSGQSSPVQTVNITYSTPGSDHWETVNWELQDAGTWWIVYHDSDLDGQAVNTVADHSFLQGGRVTLPASRFFGAVPFQNTSQADVDTLWDFTSNSFTTSQNYGLNLDFDVRCDFTQFILDQKDLFSSAIQIKVAMKILNLVRYNANARVNRNEANARLANIAYDLDGEPGNTKNSLSGRYLQALDLVKFDEALVDPLCLPCRRRGLRYKPVGPKATRPSWWA